MANEELIYRITRAVYGRLGAQADERQVEQLVTDIYRAIEPVVTTNGGGAGATTGAGAAYGEATARGAEGSAERLIVSVFGVDHPGIVAGGGPIFPGAGFRNAGNKHTGGEGQIPLGLISDHSRAP